MAMLLDPTEPEVRAAAESAREILVRLEAAPFIARLDAAMARSVDRSRPSHSIDGIASGDGTVGHLTAARD